MPYLARRFALMTAFMAIFALSFAMLVQEMRRVPLMHASVEMMPRYR